MSNDEGRIRVEAEGPVLVMTIDRPTKRNALTPAMLWQLAEAYTRLEKSPELRCGVVVGEDGHFTAGLDMVRVREHREAGRPLWPAGAVDPLGLRAPLRSKPVVVAVAGVAFTLGIELMLAADLAVAEEGVRFKQHEVSLGMLPWGGATIRMVQRAGWGRAMQYLLTGREFSAQEALQAGFVQEVCAAGMARERALVLARTIAAQAPLAVQAVILNARKAVLEGPLAAQAELDAERSRLVKTADAAEGLASFVERRPARFTGR